VLDKHLLEPRQQFQLRRHLLRLVKDKSGSIAMQAAIGLPALAIAASAALDYTNLVSQKANLQNLADTSAVASANELRTGNVNSATINAIAKSIATAAAGRGGNGLVVAAATVENGRAVQVTLNKPVDSLVGKLLSSGPKTVSASATARITGQASVCVLALNGAAKKSLEAQQTALLTGKDCGLYSNSTASNSIIAKGQAKITAKLICSAGGVAGNTKGLTPSPTMDCPAINDPLGSRPAPPNNGCNFKNRVVSGGTQSLNPGVYCGGLKITGGAKVTANPGVFVIKDGPLTVDGGSSLTGVNVGFYLTGTDARLEFVAGPNTISLKAPVTGPMAGLLIYEDRNNKAGASHVVEADDARMLLGTIYLPRGVLSIGANARVADQSAYTVIVADSIVLTGGPNMVLNANYGATNVPVPPGIGPGAITLMR